MSPLVARQPGSPIVRPAHRPVALALGLALAAGCATGQGTRTGVSGPGMNARREAALLALASPAMRCPSDALVPAFVESSGKSLHVYRVAGCGVTFNAVLRCAGACQWLALPDKRAAEALGCPVEQLELKHLDSGAWSYTGCGRAVAYTERADRWVGGAPAGP